MTEIENKLITLNSVNGIQRNGTAKSDMLFNFQNVLSDEDDIISSNICVMNAQIPVSFYIINATNYQYKVFHNSTTYTVTLPFGNYTANSLVTTMNSLMGPPIDLAFSFNQLNGKLTLTALSGGLSVSVGTFSNAIDMGPVLGFINPGQAGTSPMTLLYPMNLLGVKKLSIKSQLLGINSFQSGTNQSTTLTTIPNNNAPYTMINYENISNLNKALIKVRKIDAIDIQIEDENGNKIDFNNVDWTITLVLENIRKMTIPEIPNFMQLLKRQNELIPVNEENQETTFPEPFLKENIG
jgi:hypothetical protein